MAKIGKVSGHRPSWQNFDPSKAKLTRNQKEAAKRRELQQLCKEVVQQEKLKYAFYQVNRYCLGEYSGRMMVHEPYVRSVSRFS